MTKYKVNINRPKISTEEIVQQKDFNVVFKKYKRENHSVLKVNSSLIYIVLLILLIIVFLAVRIIKDNETNKKDNQGKGTTKVLNFN